MGWIHQLRVYITVPEPNQKGHRPNKEDLARSRLQQLRLQTRERFSPIEELHGRSFPFGPVQPPKESKWLSQERRRNLSELDSVHSVSLQRAKGDQKCSKSPQIETSFALSHSSLVDIELFWPPGIHLVGWAHVDESEPAPKLRRFL